MGQGDEGRVTHRVTCTWWLLGLAIKGPWLGLGGPCCMDRLREHYLAVSSFLTRKAAWALS